MSVVRGRRACGFQDWLERGGQGQRSKGGQGHNAPRSEDRPKAGQQGGVLGSHSTPTPQGQAAAPAICLLGATGRETGWCLGWPPTPPPGSQGRHPGPPAGQVDRCSREPNWAWLWGWHPWSLPAHRRFWEPGCGHFPSLCCPGPRGSPSEAERRPGVCMCMCV